MKSTRLLIWRKSSPTEHHFPINQIFQTPYTKQNECIEFTTMEIALTSFTRAYEQMFILHFNTYYFRYFTD